MKKNKPDSIIDKLDAYITTASEGASFFRRHLYAIIKFASLFLFFSLFTLYRKAGLIPLLYIRESVEFAVFITMFMMPMLYFYCYGRIAKNRFLRLCPDQSRKSTYQRFSNLIGDALIIFGSLATVFSVLFRNNIHYFTAFLGFFTLISGYFSKEFMNNILSSFCIIRSSAFKSDSDLVIFSSTEVEGRIKEVTYVETIIKTKDGELSIPNSVFRKSIVLRKKP